MNDIRRQQPEDTPRVASVDLHSRYHEQTPHTESSTPTVEATQTASPPPPPAPVEPQPATSHAAEDVHPEVHHSLHHIKVGLIVLIALFAAATVFFIYQTINRPKPESRPSQNTVENKSTGSTNPISCLSETGPDATTTSQTFVDIPGTACNYTTGDKPETLVLNGKLTGRNTEGTGLSVTLSVNGKDCNGGESLNYSRTYTPMYSNCVFEVPAKTSAAIKWRFLSPFGGTAAILRSNKNIAPFISGTAIPKDSDRP